MGNLNLLLDYHGFLGGVTKKNPALVPLKENQKFQIRHEEYIMNIWEDKIYWIIHKGLSMTQIYVKKLS